MKQFPKDRKEALIRLKGGICSNPDCPLKTVIHLLPPCCFDFHHRDESTKEFNLSSKCWSKSWDKLISESDKCDLLCVVCHRIKHDSGFFKLLTGKEISYGGYRRRLKRGLSPEEALNKPLQSGSTWHPKDIVTIDGISKSAKNWCAEFGINYHTYKSRISKGLDPESALRFPVRKPTLVTINGQSKTIYRWCKEFGISIQCFSYRIRSGMTPEQALTTPKSPGITLQVDKQ